MLPELSEVAQWVYKKYLSKPFPNNQKREVHDESHHVRAYIAYMVLLNLRVLWGEDIPKAICFEAQLEPTPENAEFIIYLMGVYLLFHDAMREGEGEDLWDAKSAEAFYKYVTEELKVDKSLAHIIAQAGRNKDPKEIVEYYGNYKHTVAYIIEEMECSSESITWKEKNISPKQKSLISELIKAGDQAEIIRARDDSFNVQYFDLFKKNNLDKPQNKDQLKVFSKLMYEFRALIEDTGNGFFRINEKKKALFAGEECFSKTLSFIQENQEAYPLMYRLYNQGRVISDTNILNKGVNTSKEPMDLILKAYTKNDLFFRGTFEPTHKAEHRTTCTMRKEHPKQKKYPSNSARDLSKILRIKGNPQRSYTLGGSQSYTSCGYLMIGGIHRLVSEKDIATGYGSKVIFSLEIKTNEKQNIPHELEKLRNNELLCKNWFYVSENYEKLNYPEIIGDIHWVDAIAYTKDPVIEHKEIRKDSKKDVFTGYPYHENQPVLHALYMQQEAKAHFNLDLPIYEFSPIRLTLNKKEFSEQDIWNLWSESIDNYFNEVPSEDYDISLSPEQLKIVILNGRYDPQLQPADRYYSTFLPEMSTQINSYILKKKEEKERILFHSKMGVEDLLKQYKPKELDLYFKRLAQYCEQFPEKRKELTQFLGDYLDLEYKILSQEFSFVPVHTKLLTIVNLMLDNPALLSQEHKRRLENILLLELEDSNLEYYQYIACLVRACFMKETRTFAHNRLREVLNSYLLQFKENNYHLVNTLKLYFALIKGQEEIPEDMNKFLNFLITESIEHSQDYTNFYYEPFTFISNLSIAFDKKFSIDKRNADHLLQILQNNFSKIKDCFIPSYLDILALFIKNISNKEALCQLALECAKNYRYNSYSEVEEAIVFLRTVGISNKDIELHKKEFINRWYLNVYIHNKCRKTKEWILEVRLKEAYIKIITLFLNKEPITSEIKEWYLSLLKQIDSHQFNDERNLIPYYLLAVKKLDLTSKEKQSIFPKNYCLVQYHLSKDLLKKHTEFSLEQMSKAREYLLWNEGSLKVYDPLDAEINLLLDIIFSKDTSEKKILYLIYDLSNGEIYKTRPNSPEVLKNLKTNIKNRGGIMEIIKQSIEPESIEENEIWLEFKKKSTELTRPRNSEIEQLNSEERALAKEVRRLLHPKDKLEKVPNIPAQSYSGIGAKIAYNQDGFIEICEVDNVCPLTLLDEQSTEMTTINLMPGMLIRGIFTSGGSLKEFHKDKPMFTIDRLAHCIRGNLGSSINILVYSPKDKKEYKVKLMRDIVEVQKGSQKFYGASPTFFSSENTESIKSTDSQNSLENNSFYAI